MADLQKGQVCVLLLFLFLAFPTSFRALVNCDSFSTKDENKNENENGISSFLHRQEIYLEKLENLVKNFSEALEKLESRLPQNQKGRSVEKERNKVEESRSGRQDENKIDESNYNDENLLKKEVEDENLEGRARDGERGKMGSVTKYNPLWTERFQFLSAVHIESEAMCINILPFEDYEGFSKYIAVGDERGRVYIFSPNGDVLVEFYTQSESPITSMLSYMSFHKNESVLVTGHIDGVIIAHRISEASNGEDWHSLNMETLRQFASLEKGESGSSITILEVHQVGRMKYILSSDSNGMIRVFRENGTVYGSAMAGSRPLAFLKQRLLFLTEKGAGSLDLRSMTIRESECEGMNHSHVTNYIFDASERSKGYGFSSDGDLILVVLLGDIMNFKCRVRSKRKFDVEGPLVIQTIKGYLLVVSQEKVFVYNVSSQNYVRIGGPRPLFSANLDEIRSSFLNSYKMSEDSNIKTMMPLITSDREKLIVLGLGSGYVGIYRSNLPVFKAEFSTMLWTSPALLFILFLFGAWQFFSKKKESFTSWGPDDPYSATSVPAGAFQEGSSRNDLMEMRATSLRGPSRRYVSPSRYSGGSAIPFRNSSADPNFRGANELKFRGSNLEPPGFPKRREPLFSNNQVVEDNID